jgi:hypothetical protein
MRGLANAIHGLIATLSDWRMYKRQTGEWPLLSVAVCLLHLGIVLAAVWWAVKQNWSRALFGLFVLPIAFAVMFLWNWIGGKTRAFELQRYRRRAGLPSDDTITRC